MAIVANGYASPRQGSIVAGGLSIGILAVAQEIVATLVGLGFSNFSARVLRVGLNQRPTKVAVEEVLFIKAHNTVGSSNVSDIDTLVRAIVADFNLTSGFRHSENEEALKIISVDMNQSLDSIEILISNGSTTLDDHLVEENSSQVIDENQIIQSVALNQSAETLTTLQSSRTKNLDDFSIIALNRPSSQGS